MKFSNILKLSFLFIILISSIFASTTKTTTTSTTLYDKNSNDGDIRVSTGLEYKNKLTASVDGDDVLLPLGANANNLPNGATVCPGGVDLDSDVSGDFAHGSWSSGIFAPDPSDAQANDASSYDSWVGGYSSDLSIWFSSTKYNSLGVATNAWIFDDSGLWATWTTQHDQKLNDLILFDWATGEFTVHNKEAHVSMICESNIKYYKNSVQQGGSQSVQSGSADKTLTLTPGSYNLQSKLGITGCAVIVKPNGLTGGHRYKFLYARTSQPAGPEYSYTQAKTSSISLNVENPNLEITSTGMIDSITLNPPPFCFNETETVFSIEVAVENTGNVQATVVGSQVNTPGFSIVGGLIDADTSNPITPAYVLDPGDSGNILFVLQYDGVSVIPSTVDVDLLFESPDPVCGSASEEEFTLDLDVPMCDFYCTFNPSESSGMSVGAAELFNLECYDGGAPAACVGTSYDLDPAGWTLFSPTPTTPTVTPTSTGSGTLTADTQINGLPTQCTADLHAPAPNSCTMLFALMGSPIANDSLLTDDIDLEVAIGCLENETDINCSGVTWSVNGFNSIASESDSGCVVSTSPSEDILELTATVHGGTPDEYFCIKTYEIIHNKSCEINLVSLYPEGFGSFEYNVTCFDGANPVDCGDVETELSGTLEWDLEIDGLTYPVDFTFTSIGNNLTLDVLNYLSIASEERDLLIGAAIESNVPEFDDMVCELETELPNLYCHMFI